MKSIRTLTFVFLIGLMSFGLAACGGSEYADATNTALANFNSAGNAVTEQLFMINDDNSIISDPAWKESTSAALDDFEAAGKAFASLPEAPEEYTATNELLTELAFETASFVDIARTMVETEDLNNMDALNEQLSVVNDLVSQVDDSIRAVNNQ